jgi:uncharacterized protein (DUF1501 family)
MYIRSRRDFIKDTLRSVTALGAVGGLAKFGELNALAAGSNYQALVCVFLLGGNDGHNTVIPITTAQQPYSQYQQTRGGLALPQSSLLPINNGSDVYGLHPSLVEIQGLYNSGVAAVVPNVGMLVQPVTRAQYLTNNPALVPSALFSHSDQSTQWQTGIPTGNGSSGWGGRISDLLQSQNSAAIFPPVTATYGCQVFCTGVQTFPASVPPPYNGSTANNSMATLNGLQNAPATAAGMQQLLTFNNGVQLVQAANGVMMRGNNYANTLTALLANVSLQTQFPANNPLAAQLETVASVMAVRNQLGLNRQIFFCLLDGFDTHSAQLETQGPLLQQLSQAVLAFYNATKELSIDSSVTTFTASEFGRTLTPSGTDGSDHAWGNHHFVIGTGVQGGKFFGNFPLLVPGGINDANTRGTLIPTTAVDQYGATLAQWFGVPGASLPTVFPNIANYSSNNLGFLT